MKPRMLRTVIPRSHSALLRAPHACICLQRPAATTLGQRARSGDADIEVRSACPTPLRGGVGKAAQAHVHSVPSAAAGANSETCVRLHSPGQSGSTASCLFSQPFQTYGGYG